MKSSKVLAKPDNQWPDNFPIALHGQLNAQCGGISNIKQGCIADVILAKWEANYTIMRRFVRGENIGAFVDDRYLSWRPGDPSVGVNKITIGGKLIFCSKKMIVCCTSCNTLNIFINFLPPDTQAKMIETPNSVIENVKCPHLKCLKMVVCRCNVWPSDISNVALLILTREVEKMDRKISDSDHNNESKIY